MNNFCVPELQTLKFLTQKENIVMQISAALPSADFHSGKSYVKKKTVFTFQQFVPNSHVKLKSLNWKLRVSLFQGDFVFRAAINISYREITAKRVTSIYFLPLISLKLFYFSKQQHILVEKVKLRILVACIFKNIYIKKILSYKLNILLLKTGFNKLSFFQNIDNFWLQMQNHKC